MELVNRKLIKWVFILVVTGTILIKLDEVLSF